MVGERGFDGGDIRRRENLEPLCMRVLCIAGEGGMEEARKRACCIG